MPRYASLIDNGHRFAKRDTGNVKVAGRKSDTDSLFDPTAAFKEDKGAYNEKDAEGFIWLDALRKRIAARRSRR